MSHSYFIAGDWGTSNLRLYLCEIAHNTPVKLLETRHGPGIRERHGEFEDIFFNLAQDWLDARGNMPVILSGMVGSNIGWKEAPYLTCPVGADDIAAQCINFKARGLNFSILAGLRTTNPLGQPDIMRGEELQILGCLQQDDSDAPSRHLFALPGTHNKWALLEGGQLQTFITAFTGELFALLRKNSILISDDGEISFNPDAFMQGLRAVEKLGQAHLLHSLFSVRSRQVLGELAKHDGLSYLSGQLTGADVFGALSLFNDVQQITVIGEPVLAEQYKLVLDHLGRKANFCDPGQIAVDGYAAVYRTLHAHQ